MTPDKVINWPHAKGRAEATIEGTVPDDLNADVNLSRAYLALLEAVAPLLAAAEKATPGPWAVGHDDYGDEWWFGGTGHGQVVVYMPTGESFVYGGHDLSNADFAATARNTADALRDLLGPTGGEA